MALIELPRELIDGILHDIDLLTLVIIRHTCRLFAEIIPPTSADVVKIAAKSGITHVLRWAVDTRYTIFIGNKLCRIAARDGNLDMLKYLRGCGVPWSSATCEAACRGGHIHVVKWARENGAQWNQRCSDAAAKAGAVDILEYMVKNHHTYNKTALFRAASRGGHLNVIKWLNIQPVNPISEAYRDLAFFGHMECIKWLYAAGHVMYVHVFMMRYAVMSGNLGLCKWLYAKGISTDMTDVFSAAILGYADILGWLRHHIHIGLPEPVVDPETGGFINIIEHLISRGHRHLLHANWAFHISRKNPRTIHWLRKAGFAV